VAERLPTVSAVIPTFGRRDLLPGVVEPLLADPATSEVVVVVDGSFDGSYAWLLERAEGDGRLRPFWIENRGENGAREAGVRAARGDVVLLLDDDVRAAPGLTAGHARHHMGSTGLVVLGYMPPLLPRERRPGDFTTRLYAREYEAVCRGYEASPDQILMSLWAGNMSLRREDAVAVMLGTKAPTLPYHADRELGLRCLESGLRGIFDRSLRAEHLHTRSLDGFTADARSQGAARVMLHRLHGDVLGPVDQGPPGPVRALLARTPAAAVMATALRGATRHAGRARAFRLEELFARVLRRVEQQRGALATRGFS
jgi:GT2 family glycosyltransferase